MNIDFFEVAYQLYPLPTFRITTDLRLAGYRSVDIIWWRWGMEISWGREE
jgi:hypothetical protein